MLVAGVSAQPGAEGEAEATGIKRRHGVIEAKPEARL